MIILISLIYIEPLWDFSCTVLHHRRFPGLSQLDYEPFLTLKIKYLDLHVKFIESWPAEHS